MLAEVTVESVNSALKRAGASFQRRHQAWPPHYEPPPGLRLTRRGCDRGEVRPRVESADLDTLVALLTDDVVMSMPPVPFGYEGRDAVTRFCASQFAAGRRFDLVPARANGQPAFGAYLHAPSGIRHGTGLGNAHPHAA